MNLTWKRVSLVWERIAAAVGKGNIGILLAAVAIGAVLSAAIPPFQSPDEFDHVKRAYALLYGRMLVATPLGHGSGLWVDDGLLAYMNAYANLPHAPDAKVTLATLHQSADLRWAGTQSFSPAPGVGYYFPLVYLPQAIGLLVGKSLDWSIAASYEMARLMVFLASIGLLLLAYRIFPFNFFTLGMLILPMTLFQWVSASLDGFTTALTCLCASIFMRGADRQKTFPDWMAGVLGAVIVLLGTCRLHMVAVTLMPFYLHFVRRERVLLLSGIGSIVIVLAWTAAALYTTRDMRSGIEQPVLAIAAYYLGHPGRFLQVVWATYSDTDVLNLLAKEFVGVLGWLDTFLPGWFYTFAGAVLTGTVALSVTRKSPGDDLWPRGAMLLISLSAIFLTTVLLLVTWTHHPAKIVAGLQGRYFLLPLIVLSYALSGNRRPMESARAYIGYPLLYLLGLLSLYVTVDTLIQRYFVSGA